MMADSDRRAGKNSDLGIRLASAAVLGPLVLAIAYWGGAAYAVLVLVAAALFLWEWFTVTGTSERSAATAAGYASLAVLAGCTFWAMPAFGLPLLLAGALAAGAFCRFSREGRWCLEGILYSGAALYSLMVLREGTEGLLFTFFLFIVVWATDIFAYFSGRTFGGPKLWERVSPKKTWSGAVGGLIAALLLGTGFAWGAGARQLFVWAVLAVVLSIVSQAGDLMESAIKRRFDVKDSSRLIPGHGGIMDRVDGLVAAGICAVVLGLVGGGALTDPLAGLGLQ